MSPGHIRDLITDGQNRVKLAARVRDDHGNPTATELVQLPLGKRQDILSFEYDATAGDPAWNGRKPQDGPCKSRLTSAAFANPSLKGDITVNADIVTVGDMFDNPGELSETAIFPLHAGQTVPVGVVRYRILDAVRG